MSNKSCLVYTWSDYCLWMQAKGQPVFPESQLDQNIGQHLRNIHQWHKELVLEHLLDFKIVHVDSKSGFIIFERRKELTKEAINLKECLLLADRMREVLTDRKIKDDLWEKRWDDTVSERLRYHGMPSAPSPIWYNAEGAKPPQRKDNANYSVDVLGWVEGTGWRVVYYNFRERHWLDEMRFVGVTLWMGLPQHPFTPPSPLADPEGWL